MGSSTPSVKPSFPVSLLNDPRDVVFLKTSAFNSLAMVIGVSLFFVTKLPWWAGPAYWLMLILVFIPQFTLMLHCVVHRPLFKKQNHWMLLYITWVMAPFHGQTPETYFVHHIGMHHVEGNLSDDLSSTMKYQRDNLFHWLRYNTRFMLLGLIELFLYHRRKNNTKLIRRMLVGELTWYAAVAALCFVNWQATLIVFVVPMIIMRTLMMAGNWGQHAFIDQDAPDNDFKSSITCINTVYNRRCFNDGYHIIHHLKSAMHYTEMMLEFDKNREHYGEQDAIVFDGLDFFSVWLLLMLRQHAMLARRIVQLPGAPERTQEERVAFLKTRLKPFPAPA